MWSIPLLGKGKVPLLDCCKKNHRHKPSLGWGSTAFDMLWEEMPEFQKIMAQPVCPQRLQISPLVVSSPILLNNMVSDTQNLHFHHPTLKHMAPFWLVIEQTEFLTFSLLHARAHFLTLLLIWE